MDKFAMNLMLRIVFLSAALCSLIISQTASAASRHEQEVDGRKVIEMARLRAFYSGKDRIASGSMTVEKEGKLIRTREYTVLRLDDKPGGDQSYFIHFAQPSDMTDTTFLVKKHVDPAVDDDRWLFLPKLNLVRRIAAGDKRTPFVGTDMFYEDVSGRHIDEDVHVLIGENDKYWIVKSTPKNTDSVEFAYYKTWVHKKTHLNIKVEYYKKQDKKYRVCKILKVRNIGGIPTPVAGKVADLETRTTTTSNLLSIKYDSGIPKDLFETRYLSNPPTDWLNGGGAKE